LLSKRLTKRILKMSYAGDISAADSWQMLEEHPDAILIDVRSQAEWTFVGVPDLGLLDKTPVLIEWQSYPSMAVNQDFVDALSAELRRRQAADDTPLLFLCRSGARSRAAAVAMTAAGRKRCLNVAGGFEGDIDQERHRGNVGGWKAQGLPWIQS
jgi:rhodanese-related sulfurtransferase